MIVKIPVTFWFINDHLLSTISSFNGFLMFLFAIYHSLCDKKVKCGYQILILFQITELSEHWSQV